MQKSFHTFLWPAMILGPLAFVQAQGSLRAFWIFFALGLGLALGRRHWLLRRPKAAGANVDARVKWARVIESGDKRLPLRRQSVQAFARVLADPMAPRGRHGVFRFVHLVGGPDSGKKFFFNHCFDPRGVDTRIFQIDLSDRMWGSIAMFREYLASGLMQQEALPVFYVSRLEAASEELLDELQQLIVSGQHWNPANGERVSAEHAFFVLASRVADDLQGRLHEVTREHPEKVFHAGEEPAWVSELSGQRRFVDIADLNVVLRKPMRLDMAQALLGAITLRCKDSGLELIHVSPEVLVSWMQGAAPGNGEDFPIDRASLLLNDVPRLLDPLLRGAPRGTRVSLEVANGRLSLRRGHGAKAA